MHMLRRDDEFFEQFGEIYFSKTFPNVIKAWHKQKNMTLNYTVISGNAKIVVYDDRKNSPTQGELEEIFIGDNNYCLVTIPPRVWNGHTPIGNKEIILANCATEPYVPGNMERISPFSDKIPYKWEIKHR